MDIFKSIEKGNTKKKV